MITTLYVCLYSLISRGENVLFLIAWPDGQRGMKNTSPSTYIPQSAPPLPFLLSHTAPVVLASRGCFQLDTTAF